MRLYHYTSGWHLGPILAAKALAPTESNVSLKPGEEHAGPDVVWLTSDADPARRGYGHGLDGSSANKREIRIQVEVEDAQRWRTWALRQGSSRQTMAQLARSAGGGDHTWYVVERPIPVGEWTEVRNMITGEVLLDRDALAAERGRSFFERR